MAEALAQGAADELRADFTGDVILPDDPGYDEARKVFNGMIDKRPGGDRPLREHRRRRRGGQPGARPRAGRSRCAPAATASRGMSICDDGILIDLGGLKGIDVDPDRRTANGWRRRPLGRVRRRDSGAWSAHAWRAREHDRRRRLHHGRRLWLDSSKHGLTCDNLISAEVVTADGGVLTASADENPDLFWGIARRRRQLRRRDRRSSSASTRWARSSSPGWPAGRWRRRRRCCAAGATASKTPRTSCRPVAWCSRGRPRSSCPSSCAGSR